MSGRIFVSQKEDTKHFKVTVFEKLTWITE